MDQNVFRLAKKEGRCVDKIIYDSRITKQWREIIVRSAAKSAGFKIIEMGDEDILAKQATGSPLLYWLPFFDYTDQWAQLHKREADGTNCDPTHFCYSPYQWDPVNENIARILDIAC